MAAQPGWAGPDLTMPIAPPRSPSISLSASSTCTCTVSTCLTRLSPKIVSSTPRGKRVKSVTPSSCSSARMLLVSVGCATPISPAAPVMLRCRATDRK